MKHLEKIAEILSSGTKLRNNPLTTVAEVAFANADPAFLAEFRESPEKFGFEKAAKSLSEWSDRSLLEVRGEGLAQIDDYLRKNFSQGIPGQNAFSATWWLFRTEPRMAIWCLCAVAEASVRYQEKWEGRRTKRNTDTIAAARDWVSSPKGTRFPTGTRAPSNAATVFLVAVIRMFIDDWENRDVVTNRVAIEMSVALESLFSAVLTIASRDFQKDKRTEDVELVGKMGDSLGNFPETPL